MSTNTLYRNYETITQPKETLPLFDWFGGEARYFLSQPEERQTIAIHMKEGMGEFGELVIENWELEM